MLRIAAARRPPGVRTFRLAAQLMSSSDERFIAAQTRVKAAKPDNDSLLRLYALFKQGTVGPRNTPAPGFTDFVGKAKWKAWGEVGALSPAEAKAEYVKLVDTLVGPESAGVTSRPAAATSSEGTEGPVRHRISDEGVAFVELHSKTMDNAFFDALKRAMDAVSSAAGVRVVVLRGAPGAKGFSYGLDLGKAVAEIGPMISSVARRPELYAVIQRWQAAITAIADCPVPVIAAIHGHCIGGGVDVVSAADIRLCSADAVFSVREARVGIVADLGSLQRLPHIVGPAMTSRLALTAEDINAEEAKRIGLVSEVTGDRAALDKRVDAMVEQIVANPDKAIRGTKKVLQQTVGRSVAEGLEYVAAWNAAFLDAGELAQVFAKLKAKL